MAADPNPQDSLFKRLWAGWKRIAAAIAHFQGHLILSVIYAGLLAPIACLFRLFGQNPFIGRSKSAASFWSPREPLGPVDEFLRKQY